MLNLTKTNVTAKVLCSYPFKPSEWACWNYNSSQPTLKLTALQLSLVVRIDVYSVTLCYNKTSAQIIS